MASIFDDLIPKTTTSTTKPKTGYTGTMFADLIPDKKQTKKELLSSSFDYKSAEDIQNMSFSEKEAYKSKLSKDIGSFMPFSSSKQAIPTQSRPIQEDLEQLSPVQQEQYKTKYRTLLDEEMKKTTYTERLATAVPNYFLAEKFQDTKSPIIRALNFDEIQMLTPQERTQYKELLKKDIFDGLADTTLTPENKKVLQTEEGTKEFSLGNPLKLSLELTAMMYGVKTPKAVKDFLNTPIGKEAMLSVAENTENIPVKLLAKFQEQTKIPIMGNVNVGAEYEKILNAWVEAGTNPDAPAWKRFLYTTQSTLPQTALGVLLNVSGNYILPGAGNALSGAYWMALSGSDQIQRRGKIYSVTNLGIDVALDSFLGNSIEGIFKKGAKDILIKEMGKNGVIEGGTEVSQTLLKYANDWASAPNERAKKEILAQAVNYVKSGDMFMEFASSFVSGAIIGGAGNVVDAKIRPQAKINVKTDMGQIVPPTDGGITPPGQTEMAQETIETPQQVETPVKDEIELVEQLRGAKGKTADDIMKTFPNIKLTKAVGSKDVYGNKIEIKKGEKLTPYEMKDGKILLQDGETYLVTKNQFANIKGQSVVAEGKPFAPELEGLEETVKGAYKSTLNDKERLEYRRLADIQDKLETDDFYMGETLDKDDYKRLNELRKKIEKDKKDTEKYRTQYSDYTLPGGENYKEILIKAPSEGKQVNAYKRLEKELQSIGYGLDYDMDGSYFPTKDGNFIEDEDLTNDVKEIMGKYQKKYETYEDLKEGEIGIGFISSHWDEPNVISHLRMNNRTYNSKKVSFMEELQSDWAREARANKTGLSNPLLKNWQELSIKRALIEAVNDKADYFAWITGEQTSARYNLATHIDSVQWRPFNYKEGKLKDIRINPQAGRTTGLDISIDEMGIIKKQSDAGDWVGKKLDEVLGKGLADKIMEKESGTLSGEGLKFGGEWASNLYDKQVKDIVEKLTGQKVEMIDLGLPIEKEKLFNIRKLANGREWGVFTYKESDLVGAFATQQEALDYVKSNTPSTQQQAIKLTPEVKNKIKGIAPKIKTSGIQTEKVERVVSTPKVETTPLEAKTTPEKDSPQDLMEEARKYKTADEFVKAQGTPVYRTEKADIAYKGKAVWGDGKYFGIEKNQVKEMTKSPHSGKSTGGNVDEYVIPSNLKIKEVDISWDAMEPIVFNKFPRGNDLKKQILNEGYDGVILKTGGDLNLGGDQLIMYKNADNIKTKSQLIDIWNKAQEQAIEKPKGKETKLGKSIALKAIEDKLIKTYEGVAEYTPTTIEKQAKMSNDLLQNDMEGVRQIFRGQRDLPKGLNPSALVVATETFLKENKIADAPQILAEMMNSNLVSESSVAGQTLRLLAEREQDSATAKLQEIKKHREEKVKKVTKKTVASVANDASLFMSQDNLNQLEKNLDNFLDSITC